jgi:MtN3 and saliva related transmembrane protein
MSIVLYNYNNSVLTELGDEILIDFFGYSSGVLVGITLIPQVIKVLKTKRAEHLSHKFLIISLFASIFKLIYGVLINALPIVVTAPIILIETVIIMVAKCIFDERMKKTKKKSQEVELTDICGNII